MRLKSLAHAPSSDNQREEDPAIALKLGAQSPEARIRGSG